MKLLHIAILSLTFAFTYSKEPLYKAFSHNDYMQKRPLFEALDNDFNAVEADVHAINGRLFVGHDKADTNNKATLLTNQYLKPLFERYKANGKKIQPDSKHHFYLMIDFKTADEITYKLLLKELEPFKEMLVSVKDGKVTDNAVLVFISGSKIYPNINPQNDRFVFFDGRFTDFDKNIPASVCPVVSDDLSDIVKSVDNPTKEDIEKLKSFVAKAHSEGKKIRFWATPDTEFYWNFLNSIGADFINTDKPKELRLFFSNRFL